MIRGTFERCVRFHPHEASNHCYHPRRGRSDRALRFYRRTGNFKTDGIVGNESNSALSHSLSYRPVCKVALWAAEEHRARFRSHRFRFFTR